MLDGNELPSLISALLGRPWKPTGKGFTSWLEWWNVRISGQTAGHILADIPRQKDIIGTRIFRNSKTFVAEKLWPTLDPIIRRYTGLAEKHELFPPLESKILVTLKETGPARTDKLREILKLKGKSETGRFHRALSQLESYGLIVGYEDPKPEKHLHAAIWQPWQTRVRTSAKSKTDLSYAGAMMNLLASTIDAAILAPSKEVKKWFRWKGVAKAQEDLLKSGKILEAGSFLITPRTA